MTIFGFGFVQLDSLNHPRFFLISGINLFHAICIDETHIGEFPESPIPMESIRVKITVFPGGQRREIRGSLRKNLDREGLWPDTRRHEGTYPQRSATDRATKQPGKRPETHPLDL